LADIIPGENKTYISGGVGTAAAVDRAATLRRIVWGGTYVGTVNIHDASAATGTTATSQVLSLGLPLTRYPHSLECGFNMRNGIVYQATGTPVVTLVWS